MNEQNNDTINNELINLLLEDGLESSLSKIAELLMNTAMLLERIEHIGAQPYQREQQQRNGYANGFKPRSYHTAMGKLELELPQVRESDTPFRTSLLERGSRSERSLKAAIATMYVEGISTRRVTRVMKELCGLEVSATQVSKLTSELDVEFERWRNRQLPEIAYLTLDATYHKVRLDGIVRDCATLTAIGVRLDDGKRMILGVSCALSEAEEHWKGFLVNLKERGIGSPDLITSDAHTGLRAALKEACNSSPWQRCQFHLQQNAQDYVTKQNLKSKVASDIKNIFNSDDLEQAQQRLDLFVENYKKDQPRLATWAEENLPEGFAVFSLPHAHRKRLRTSNACETLNGQIKRRTRVVGLFPNEASLLRLVTAVLIEISETWETGKSYLKLN